MSGHSGQLGPLGHHIVPYISDTINDIPLKLKPCLMHKRTVFQRVITFVLG